MSEKKKHKWPHFYIQTYFKCSISFTVLVKFPLQLNIRYELFMRQGFSDHPYPILPTLPHGDLEALSHTCNSSSSLQLKNKNETTLQKMGKKQNGKVLD